MAVCQSSPLPNPWSPRQPPQSHHRYKISLTLVSLHRFSIHIHAQLSSSLPGTREDTWVSLFTDGDVAV